MNKTILITGGLGFLGRSVANKFKKLGYRVVGIGHGQFSTGEAPTSGFDFWLDASITVSNLMMLDECFDLVVHCAGNASVGHSIDNPLLDFTKTVQGTIELLEFLRLTKSGALLIYPSSAGVYGSKEDAPIKEDSSLNPVSPYGYHKCIAEKLLESYSKNYGVRSAVIRFFSIYGPGLTKQLLWDASRKFFLGANESFFWGTGNETRDWISGEDATELIVEISHSDKEFFVVNGASGQRITVLETLTILKNVIGSHSKIVFNGAVRQGDPQFYHADMTRTFNLGWRPKVPLYVGIQNYVQWLTNHRKDNLD